MSTLNSHQNPVESSADDDPTGVRALLSGLPEPGPMPAYLVERINASLVAAQAERAASPSGTSVAPLVASKRGRPGRVLLAIAGAAAAVVLVAVVGGNLLKTNDLTAATDSGAVALSSRNGESEAGAPPSVNDKAAPGGVSATPTIAIRRSEIRYTRDNFVTQARVLPIAATDTTQPGRAYSAAEGRIATAAGLVDCLRAIGASGAQTVQADIAFYDGAQAVIIVATTNGIPAAYAVGRECSLADPAVLRPATPLP